MFPAHSASIINDPFSSGTIFPDCNLFPRFNNTELINNNGLYEKDMIRWIELGKIKNDYNMFRKGFKRILKDPYFN